MAEVLNFRLFSSAVTVKVFLRLDTSTQQQKAPPADVGGA